MWFIGVEAEQETSAPPPKKNPGSAPVNWDIKINSNESLNTSKSRIQNNAHSQLIHLLMNAPL